jgi:hypothetical protein
LCRVKLTLTQLSFLTCRFFKAVNIYITYFGNVMKNINKTLVAATMIAAFGMTSVFAADEAVAPAAPETVAPTAAPAAATPEKKVTPKKTHTKKHKSKTSSKPKTDAATAPVAPAAPTDAAPPAEGTK